MATKEIDIIKTQTRRLTADQKVELIEFLTRSLHVGLRKPKLLEFGKYAPSGRRMSNAADFTIAEWHPSDRELDGN